MNGEYMKMMEFDRFFEMAEPYIREVVTKDYDLKKIAASIAALGAVTFAHAANVEFYGSIDNSVSYIKAKGQNGQASMYASNDSSPKLGLTGKEDIGNGHFVRFKLENGYSVEIAHTSAFRSVINGLTEVYCSVGNEVAGNVPVGYSDGSAEVSVSMYNGGEPINGYTLSGALPVWNS